MRRTRPIENKVLIVEITELTTRRRLRRILNALFLVSDASLVFVFVLSVKLVVSRILSAVESVVNELLEVTSSSPFWFTKSVVAKTEESSLSSAAVMTEVQLSFTLESDFSGSKVGVACIMTAIEKEQIIEGSNDFNKQTNTWLHRPLAHETYSHLYTYY